MCASMNAYMDAYTWSAGMLFRLKRGANAREGWRNISLFELAPNKAVCSERRSVGNIHSLAMSLTRLPDTAQLMR